MMRVCKPKVRRAQAHLVILALLLALSPAAQAEESKRARIVSIGGDVTEIIYALGEQGRLVGRDSTSVYPEATRDVPDVGYMRQLSPEGILATNPDAIIAVEGSGPPDALSVLAGAGVPLDTVPERYDGPGIAAKIERVGALLGVADKARALAARVEADLSAAVTASAAHPDAQRKRVLFILSLQGGKIMAAGRGTAADAIVTLAGAVNATTAFSGYKPVTDEAIIEAKPDLVLMMTRGGAHGVSDADLFRHPALALTPAAQTKAIIRMDGLHLLGFGPRTASAVRDLNAAIYGQTDAAR